MSEIWYTYSDGTREMVYSYEYTKDGQLYKFCDHIQDRYTVYNYTGTGKLSSIAQYDGEDMEYGLSLYCTYNDRDYLYSTKYRLSYYESSTPRVANIYDAYFYNSDGTVYKKHITANSLSSYLDYTYDDYKRLTGVDLNVGSETSPTLSIDYDYTYRTYTSGSTTYTDGYVSTFTSTVNGTVRTYTYTYDSNGNITKITDSGGATAEYTYDNLNQLVREDNGILGYTYTYTYDDAGNILSKSKYALTYADSITSATLETKAYGYSATQWGDMLISYGGQTITYDALGNPLSYYNGSSYTFTWDGRQLSTANYNGKSMSYTYNDEGIRTSKTVNGVTTTYHLNGSQIIAEETDTYVIVYLYDAAGSPIGMQYRKYTYAQGTWDTYFFEKNLQGDIVAVYSKTGTKLVTYTYDAWGNATVSYTNGGASTGAAKNPFRYRGYYFDSELNLYYLNSRYYDSSIGRFINADAAIGQIGNIQGVNMFAYCFNNPVNMSDASGCWPEWSSIFTGIAVAALTVAAVAVIVVTAGAAVPAVAIVGGGVVSTTAASVATGAMVVACVSTTAAVMYDVAENATEKNTKRNNSVYVLKDDAGKVQYVGRTNNVDKRKAAHNANPARTGLKFEVIASGLNQKESRALEQAAMAYYHTINTANKMNNQINSVSPKFWGTFKELALGVLKYGWNQMSNEILYWTGN